VLDTTQSVKNCVIDVCLSKEAALKVKKDHLDMVAYLVPDEIIIQEH
jgi:hypothetical protein